MNVSSSSLVVSQPSLGASGAGVGEPAHHDALSLAYQAEYGQRLDLIEEIRHELNLEDLNAPGIVVIGNQSAGKSSVLSRLTGISFPSGDNMCTRAPTIVQTKSDPTLTGFSAAIAEDATFTNAVICSSMSDLQRAIVDFTVKLSGGTTSLTTAPIHIRHTRASGPVMTLIDLPGITHFDPLNENFDIHSATCELVRSYVCDDNMIMLVVIPATEDFANSEALRIAQQFDPAGSRTVGVVSKCDMVPENSDILDKMLMSRPSDISLALGFIGLRNRAMHEDASSVDGVEEHLFATHPLLRMLKPMQRGIDALTAKVVALQGEAVDRFFSQLRTHIWHRKHDLSDALGKLPRIPATSDERRDILIDVLCQIDRKVGQLLQTEDVTEMSLNIPANTFALCEKFGEDILGKMPNFLKEEAVDEVRLKQKMGRGRVLPDSQIDTVIGQQVREMLFGKASRTEGHGVVHQATEELIDGHVTFMVCCYETVVSRHTNREVFPLLAGVIVSELGRFIGNARRKAMEIAEAILAAEQSICFTQNAMYVQTVGEMRRAAATGGRMDDGERRSKTKGGMVERLDDRSAFRSCPLLRVCPTLLGQGNVDEDDYIGFLGRFVDEAVTQSETWSLMKMQFSIHVYLHVVIKRLCDVVPMVVRNALVYELHDGFLSHISRVLSEDPSILEAAMRESPKDRETRETLEKRYSKLEEVLGKMRQLGLDKGFEEQQLQQAQAQARQQAQQQAQAQQAQQAQAQAQAQHVGGGGGGGGGGKM